MISPAAARGCDGRTESDVTQGPGPPRPPRSHGDRDLTTDSGHDSRLTLESPRRVLRLGLRRRRPGSRARLKANQRP